MADNKSFEGLDLSDIGISIDNFVATVEIQRPPNNFFDTGLINDLANIISQMDQSDEVRAVVYARRESISVRQRFLQR